MESFVMVFAAIITLVTSVVSISVEVSRRNRNDLNDFLFEISGGDRLLANAAWKRTIDQFGSHASFDQAQSILIEMQNKGQRRA